MSAQIELDEFSRKKVMQSLSGLKSVDWYEGLLMVLFRIKALAQLRLSEKEHILTSRLKNSIYVQSPKQSQADAIANEMQVNNNRRYSWPPGKTTKYGKKVTWQGGNSNANMETVNLKVDEGAVGTNVEYAGKIERMDSYLYWAAKNINKNIRTYFQQVAKENQRKYAK